MEILRLKEILKGKSITSKSLAESVEVSETAISMIIQGKRQPRFELLLKIAAFLDVDIRELFHSTKKMNSEIIYVKRDDSYIPAGELKENIL